MFPRTFVFMLACAGIGYMLGRSRGMPMQGLLLGLAFGPLGWALVLLWPSSWVQASPRPEPRPQRRPQPPPRSQGRPSGGPPPGTGSREEAAASNSCPRCRRPADSEAGACPHCGNVLIPVTYRVN